MTMRQNAKGTYSGTAAQEDDYVIWQHGTSRDYFVDRVGRGGKAVRGIGSARGSGSLKAAVQVVRAEALRRGYTSGIIFEQRAGEDELRQIGQVKRGTGMDFEQNGPRGPRTTADETAARELSLYIENDYALVGAPNSVGKSIEKNLLRKLQNGTFNLALSEKAWMYLMEAGAKKYSKEFSDGRDWATMFNKSTRELVAHEFATTFYEEHKATGGLARNASDFTIEEFDAPAHWASAFINGDTSGLEEEDLADFEAWNAKHPDLGWVVDVSEETHIGRFGGLQTELATYTAHVHGQTPNSGQPFRGNETVIIEKRDSRGKLDFSAPQPPRNQATFDQVYDWYFRAVPEGNSASWSDLKAWLDERGWVLRAKTW
jgi:hypothetical protein